MTTIAIVAIVSIMFLFVWGFLAWLFALDDGGWGKAIKHGLVITTLCTIIIGLVALTIWAVLQSNEIAEGVIWFVVYLIIAVIIGWLDSSQPNHGCGGSIVTGLIGSALILLALIALLAMIMQV